VEPGRLSGWQPSVKSAASRGKIHGVCSNLRGE
jgi:hypothetical protein